MEAIKQAGEYKIVLCGSEIFGKFNTKAIAIIERIAGTTDLVKTLNYCQSDYNINKIAQLLYASHQAYCSAPNSIIEASINSPEEALDYMDDFGTEELAEMLEAFGNSTILKNKMNFGISRQNEPEEGGKEKTLSQKKK